MIRTVITCAFSGPPKSKILKRATCDLLLNPFAKKERGPRICLGGVVFLRSRLRRNSVRSLSAAGLSQRECALLDYVGWSQLRSDNKQVITVDHPFHVGVYRTKLREAQLAKIVYRPSVEKLVFNGWF